MSGKFPIRGIPKWMLDSTCKFRSNAAMGVALGVLTSCCAVLLMFTAGYLISRTAQPGITLFMVMVPVAFVQVFGIGRPLARYFERLVSHDWVLRVTSHVRLALFRASEALSASPNSAMATGTYLDLLSDGIGNLQNLYLRVLLPCIISIALCICACVFSGAFATALGLIVAAIGVIAVVLVPIVAMLSTRRAHIESKNLRKEEHEALADDVIGAIDWAISGRGRHARKRHAEALMNSTAPRASVRRTVRIAELASFAVFGLGVVAVTYAAATSFKGGFETAAYVAAFALAIFPLAESFAVMPGALAESTSHIVAIGELDEAIAAGDCAHAKPNAEHDDAGEAAVGSISMKNATYRYPGFEKAALRNVRLDIARGEKVAVIGRSGSGKSTMCGLLRATLEPDEGTVTVNGAPPSPQSIAYIPQAPYIFDASLRENIVLASPEADDAQIEDVLNRVGLGQRLMALPCGLDSHIGETGEGLSGGEAHRVALARALLADNPVVLLDEPFSSLDPDTERKVLETLLDVFEGKTLVVITHHLAGIERFDRVIQMEDGCVKLDGSPRILAEKEPSFKRLLDFDRGMDV